MTLLVSEEALVLVLDELTSLRRELVVAAERADGYEKALREIAKPMVAIDAAKRPDIARAALAGCCGAPTAPGKEQQ